MNEAICARVERGGFVESKHHVLAVVTEPDGTVLASYGDPSVEVLPRSANKPFQALAMLNAGADLQGKYLALATASHGGEDFHRAGVLEMLAAAGLAESDLQNTPDLPLHEPSAHAWLAAGNKKCSLTQNCSGKHAGMLTACVVAGWPTSNYLDQTHPLQQEVLRQMADFGIAPRAVVVDGCGAPAHSMELRQLAHAYGQLAAATDGPRKLVADAFRQFPEYVAGIGRANTDFIRLLPGAIAKDGAEGVLAVGLDDGRGIALKVQDGASRPRYPALGALLQKLGVGDEKLYARLADEPVLGHGKPVGAVRVTL